MSFEEEYQSFLDRHTQARKGERLRRLKEGHGQAEKMFLSKVWWPLFHQFHYLHPEYEVDDFKDGKRYLDFAYLRSSVKICFEVDGYGPHLKNISRWQFADSLERQNHLIIDGWDVIRFSYDQIIDYPRKCQQMTQLAMARLLGEELEQQALSHREKEVIRLAMRNGSTVTPREVGQLLDLSDKPVKKLLTELLEKRILVPVSGKQRVHKYRLVEGVVKPFNQL